MIRAYVGAALCIAWAVLTAIAYLRAQAAIRPIPKQEADDVQLWDMRTYILSTADETGDRTFRIVVPPTTSWTI